ncbi:MAG: metabolite traffic protein EboE [Pirellulaceae bacterium]|jgi:hypothetical protein|nr:metabolite traffic protein EboE [Pirellulaceae bacterium]
MKRRIGYCTNVHAGADLEATQANLSRHALAVKASVRPDSPMGVGLWLSADAANSLVGQNRVGEFSTWLNQQGLLPFTLNGFPYGDFHQPVVKHAVYLPTWWDSERLVYTQQLISILHGILPPDEEGSISTLPIAWGSPTPSESQLQQAAANLVDAVESMARLEAESGRLIYLCVEPEPGCVIQFSQDIINFFDRYLLAAGNEHLIRRHLRVCHDVCHAAVMFEDQAAVIDAFDGAGIGIGKVQVSAAVHAPFDELSSSGCETALQQLQSFAEDRYLHQTSVDDPNGQATFFDDLPAAIDAARAGAIGNRAWRVHFHVPIFLAKFGLLRTSQPQIIDCLSALRAKADVKHYEVETYAWDVLPDTLRKSELADGVASEIRWLDEQFAALDG